MLDTQSWLKEISVREDDDKRRSLNYSQFEVVKFDAERVCNGMDVLSTDDCESFPETNVGVCMEVQVQEKHL